MVSLMLSVIKSFLASNNLTVDQFENGRRHELKTRHVLTAVVATGIGSRKVAEQVSIAFETEREVQVLRFSPNDFVSKVNPSQQDIESFYQSNINTYQAPENVEVEYVILQGTPKQIQKNSRKKQICSPTWSTSSLIA
jgi:peptidyl-prolyl cis-trans isomerase D